MKLICYLSNGYPSIADSIEMAKTYAEAGCDIIETDFPARNPFLESNYLADRMRQALAVCDDYEQYMEGMITAKKLLPDTTFILLVYEETVLEIGADRLLNFCINNGFKDMILVGIKDEGIKNRLIEQGIRVSCYIQFHLLPEEIEQAKRSNGFVYMQGKPVNGAVHPSYPALKDCITYLRDQGITMPIYCGVGIHTPEDVRMAREAGADGVFVGSAILKLHDDRPALFERIRRFKSEC
ncbi:MAG: tryptophan synthase subunit alpha [Treponema sp.]|nr:tryptophan synthase subunit alpha [Treponema sp.]